MNAMTSTGNPSNLTDAEYLIEIQNMCRDMGIRVPNTLEEATRKYNTLAPIPTDTAVRTRFAEPGQVCGRGRVRKISDRQLNYLRNLINTRNYRKIMAEKWFTSIGATSHMDLLAKVEFISLKGASTMIDALKGCPLNAAAEEAAQTVPMASSAQLSYLSTLLSEREHNFAGDIETLTKSEASDLIGTLKDAPRKAVAPITKEDVKAIAGVYELDGDIYRMKKARQGSHFYAMILDREAGDAWNYCEGMARKVPAQGRKLTLDECEALSLRMGGCVMCGRTLTATVDGVGPAARFIGPVCAAKMGF